MDMSQDPLDAATELMSGSKVGSPSVVARAGLWIALDIARSLRDMRWSLERLAQFQQERQ